ncbi:MAG: serine--tRNA ligase [Planctomycetes bacterium]|jgi:seryl-tRNA synthetase|nr:serine--tRNA ligase [Planctomycetota bacterium]
MLDAKLIRGEPEKVREALAAKGETADIDRWLDLDRRFRERTTAWQVCRAELNAGGEAVARAKKEGRDASEAIALLRDVKARDKALREEVENLEKELDGILLRVPNIPHPDVPRGTDASGNLEVSVHGVKPGFAFPPKAHWDLGAALGILDIEAGSRIAGSGFPVLRGAGARLERALISFMLDLHTGEHGYTEISPPHMSRAEAMVTCGQIPKLEADMYRCRDDELYMIPTAEVPLTNLHRDEVLDVAVLPRRYTALTPCYRREAGAAGRDTRGLIRVHQFFKVELMAYARPEDSEAELLRLRGCAEEVLRRLGLHYRVVLLCTGDMSFASRRTFDLEVWAPGVGRYLEVSSCSVFGDFQARRAGTRFREGDAKPRFVHTLNGSALALPRTWIAVLEQWQRADGSVEVPPVLRPYMGGLERIGPPGGRA